MTAIEKWVCFRLDSKIAYVFPTHDLAKNWLKDPNRQTGWFICPVYAEGLPDV